MLRKKRLSVGSKISLGAPNDVFCNSDELLMDLRSSGGSTDGCCVANNFCSLLNQLARSLRSC